MEASGGEAVVIVGGCGGYRSSRFSVEKYGDQIR